MVIRPAELAMLLDGIDLNGVKRRKRYQRPQANSATASTRFQRAKTFFPFQK